MPRPSAREKLLSAGLDTLHRRGFNGSGVQEITDAAGVPKGSFYNHFESKEALGAEVIDRCFQTTSARRAILSDESLSPLERLRRYFDGLAAALEAAEFAYGCLLGNFSAELADQSRLVRDRLSSVFAAWTRAIEGCIRDAQRAGEVRKDMDAATLAAFLINAWEGAVLRARVEKHAAPLEQFNEVVFSKILR
ncbi:MAG TPA: TetR family transcriptional regulator C-terminal domain-containing protein [Polyangiaceae bacterium]|nr:TetR family transcriptional regulator C-terminal domain-containing protein [Polyangiaceae bacterium]